MHSAYAKINLGLFVVEKRPDGFHNILTVFHRVDVSDRVRFEEASSIEMTSDESGAPADEANLCFQAARLIQENLAPPRGVRIQLEKRIPIGAGLGGGSADAGCILRHLPAFWGTSIPVAALENMALSLGADVAYFLRDGSALGTERGDKLRYFDLDIPFFILLCNPGIHIPTSWAYRQVVPRHPGQFDLTAMVKDGMRDPALLRDHVRNDFEPAVFVAHPVVGEIKATMLARGAAYASMAGSGSTVFGLFEKEESVGALAGEFSGRGFKTFITTPHFRP